MRPFNKNKFGLKRREGFTLIELLVVIAIVAILSIVVLLTLNPAELLRQARDSDRISDLSTLKSAVSLYLADVILPNVMSSSYRCWIDGPSTNTCSGWFPTTSATSTTNSRAVDGTGWVPVNFKTISSGAPFGQLPLDPKNDVNFFYSYTGTSSLNGFKMAAKIESTKYGTPGTTNGVIDDDGGVDPTTYEQGTNLAM
jgi:prepilin-type N-terminal cleavage/methylation domain-containing protein